MSYSDDAQKRRGDHYEAMWVGTTLGTAQAIKNMKARHRATVAELETLLSEATATLVKQAEIAAERDAYKAKVDELLARLSDAVGKQVNIVADRDAHKILSKAIIDELKHLEKPRKFSSPDADLDRGRLLQETYRQSWEATVARVKKDDITALWPEAIEASRKRALKKVLEFKNLALTAKKEAG
jgi:hypothetical protein